MIRRESFKHITGFIPVIFIIILCSCNVNREVTEGELKGYIKYLSSDSLQGRLTGSAGDSLAADYIRGELASFGFKPLTGNGFQSFRVMTKLITGPENDLSVEEKQFVNEKDFMPLAFSSNSGLIAEVVFTGYGFNISLDSLKWNDYEEIDVKDKWVLLLRADPETDKMTSPFIPYSSDLAKVITAKDMGAAGVLLVSGPNFDDQDTFEPLGKDDFSMNIPVIRIKRDVADFILARSKKTVAYLEKKLNESRKPISFPANVMVSAKAELIREMTNTRNVVMALPGEDETLKNEYIIIGAHFDHLGMGGKGSGSRVSDTIVVHHGADDNASGVGMMLELAEKFAETKESHKRSIVCIAFTGEEEGLLGSGHFAENPGIDLSKVNAMINLDMVGRLHEARSVQISGVGTSDGLRELITSVTDTSLIRLSLSDEGYGPSDHSSFYGKDIPVLFFTTGVHLDYHTPSDTYDKINYKGMVTVSSLIFDVTEKLASSPDRLKFREAGPKEDQGIKIRRKGVTLGIMPDFAGNVKNGLRADFVSPGRPAALGGMKKGDIITAINGMSVTNIRDYMFRMGQFKHGEIIIVEVLRNNNKLMLQIQL